MPLVSPLSRLALACLVAAAAQGASATTVDWTTWTSQASNTVNGTLMVGSTPVGVTYSGAYFFAQLNGVGIDYYSPTAPYLSSTVSNAPVTDIIALGAGGTSVITFSQAVVNPLIALVSWNGANVTFGGGADTQTYNLQYLSSGCGYWGCGSYASPTANSFVGSGELHGVIELLGTYSSISFTDSVDEYWHGLTVGVEGGLANPVPEPRSDALTLAGLLAVGAGLRRRLGARAR